MYLFQVPDSKERRAYLMMSGKEISVGDPVNGSVDTASVLYEKDAEQLEYVISGLRKNANM